MLFEWIKSLGLTMKQEKEESCLQNALFAHHDSPDTHAGDVSYFIYTPLMLNIIQPSITHPSHHHYLQTLVAFVELLTQTHNEK